MFLWPCRVSLSLFLSRFVPLTLTLIKLCSCFGHSHNKQLQLSALNGCINAKRYFFSPSLCFSFSLSVTHSMLGCLVDKLSSIYMVCCCRLSDNWQIIIYIVECNINYIQLLFLSCNVVANLATLNACANLWPMMKLAKTQANIVQTYRTRSLLSTINISVENLLHFLVCDLKRNLSCL